MRKLAAITALLLAICVVALLLRRRSNAASDAARTDAALSARSAELADSPESAALVSSAVTSEVTRSPALAEESRTEVALGDRTELHGRFVDERGLGVADVHVTLSGRAGPTSLRIVEPNAWRDVEARTAADGTFTFTFDPPPGFRFTTRAELAGCATLEWLDQILLRGRRNDLGTWTLERAGSIQGAIVDEQGRPLAGEWRVSAQPRRASAGGPGRAGQSVRASDDGRFRLDDVPCGPTRVTVASPLCPIFEAPDVEVIAGGIANVDIVCREDFAHRIVVMPRTNTWFTMSSQVERMVLRGPGVEELEARVNLGRYQFDDVPPGKYTIDLEDPRFAPWSRTDVAPGSTLRWDVRGSASVQLAVLDAATHAPVERYGVRVRWTGDLSPQPGGVVELVARGASTPVDGVLDGLFPRRQTLLVRADGYAEREIEIELQPGERGALVVELDPGTRVDVLATESDGATPTDGGDLTLERIVDERTTDVLRAAFADAQGRATFDDVAPGRYRVSLRRTPLLGSDATFEVSPGERSREVRIVLPACGWLTGRLVAGAPFDPTWFRLRVEPREVSHVQRAELDDASRRAEGAVGPDATFRVGPLPAGRLAVFVELVRTDVRMPGGLLRLRGERRELGEIVLAPQQRLERDFDVSELLPATVDVRVTKDGAPLGFATVLIVQPYDNGERGTFAALDARGFGRSGPVLAGSSNVRVVPGNGGWVWRRKEPLTLRVGERATLDLDVRIVTASATFLDPSGSPIARREVWVRPTSGGYAGSEGWTWSTDEHGTLRLSLQPGDYEAQSYRKANARTGEPSELLRSTFEWREGTSDGVSITLR